MWVIKTVQTCAGIYLEFKPLHQAQVSQGQSFPGASLDVFIDLLTFIYSYWKNLFFQFILTEHLLLLKEMRFLLNCKVSAVFNCENLRMFIELSRVKCNLNVKCVRIVLSIHLPTFTHTGVCHCCCVVWHLEGWVYWESFCKGGSALYNVGRHTIALHILTNSTKDACHSFLISSPF